ncbi:MAG: OsmC family protein [Candidatus Lokiarchaeota archaeon]|nr:OsmC family protein [Candidatus Lokiarchaeota archaeon]
MSKKLISDETVSAYKNRLDNMNKYKFTEEGDRLYISTMVAESEQVENLHVRTKIGNISIECDAPKELNGSGTISTAMNQLLASLGNCMQITALIYFTFADVKIKSLKVKLEATYDKRAVLILKDAPLPGFYDYKITWFIESDENIRKIKQVLERVERNCPVRGSLVNPKKFSEEIVLNNQN